MHDIISIKRRYSHNLVAGTKDFRNYTRRKKSRPRFIYSSTGLICSRFVLPTSEKISPFRYLNFELMATRSSCSLVSKEFRRALKTQMESSARRESEREKERESKRERERARESEREREREIFEILRCYSLYNISLGVTRIKITYS